VEVEISGNKASHILLESRSINDVNVCNKSWSYERHLKEALELLVSLRTASELLQKELHIHTTPENMWKSNKDPNHNNGDVSVNGEWSLIKAKNHVLKSRKRDQSATVKTGQFVRTANCYTPQAEVHADNVGTIPVVVNGYISTKRNAKVNNRNASCRTNGGIGETKRKKKKIIVIGDSHSRGCARELSSYLCKEFEVRGTVTPGAGLAHITTLAQEEIPKLTPNVALVIRGGSNDINKNEISCGLKPLENFVNHRKNKNILALTAPHRHDLQETSCINKEIQVFNRKVRKFFKVRDNVSIIDTDLHRNDFTQHGLHLNTVGKEKVAESIAKTINPFRSTVAAAPTA
jgi:hypothetical protein